MIEELLPDGVASACVFEDLPADADGALFPAESAAVSKAVPRRQAEFRTVRGCARRALGELGVPAVELLPGRRGATAWPPGISGSMTHCPGFRAAAVARTQHAASIGIDAEPNLPTPEVVLRSATLPPEHRAVTALSDHRPEIRWDRLLFSAKESVFKAWYPLMRRELEFYQAEIEIDPNAGTFTAQLLVPGPVVAGRRLDTFSGRWLVRRGLIVTAITLPGSPEEEAHEPTERQADGLASPEER
ncbi:4'-phosphopantetheinyl transferase superfamily protein [Kitasatospora sp. NBC_01287]|uniref:4'-phosphopantetheinyl transferase family protein n=1 Tax=Kitasatospora sp. NBC_01287 TaxID=2903573 RepID=UPI00224FF4D4|nr:4'-phosphopantetheinyl transferase superfamily protein [Kitasatospora sp. NBC_01287]MCX4743993.1 4'-phosphopantetheinyl transferase superfamily protein [Kitasatospora sp. NBC_01287]